MIEVTFTEGAGGSMAAAKERRLGFFGEDEPHELYCIALELDIGRLDGDICGPERAEVLDRLYGNFQFGTEVRKELIASAERALAEIPDLLKRGDAIRLWYSDRPAEKCAAMCIASWLHELPVHGKVHLVQLPTWIERSDGVVEMHTGCDELSPDMWEKAASFERVASDVFLSGMHFEWMILKAENAPLRSEIAGRILSVPADFYDFLIRHEARGMSDIFHEALLIGNVLGRSQVGISDAWIAMRIDAMIDTGELEVVETENDEDAPAAYARMLRRTSN